MAVPSLQQLRAFYVKPNHLGRVGTVLLTNLEQQAFKTSESLICDASLNAAKFHTVNGYVEQGSVDHVLSSVAAFLACE